MRYADPQLVDQLASAYVLGTMSGGARRRFERLRSDRVDVAVAVRQWEARLGGLAAAVTPIDAPERVWRAIEARLRPGAPATARTSRAGSWWPTALGLSGVAGGLMLAYAALTFAPALFVSADQVALRTGGRLPQSYVGLLTDDQGNGKLLVSSLRQGRTMTIKAIGPIAPPAPGQQLVLWAVPGEGKPFVLGTVPIKGSATSQLPDTSEKLLSKVGKLVVSVESSATPAAPGTVVYRGNCAKLW